MKVSIGKYRKPYRKVKIELIEDDMFCLDNTLAKIIHPCLVKFKEGQTGYPYNLSKKKWNEILDKMIWAFSNIANDNMTTPAPSDYGINYENSSDFNNYELLHADWTKTQGYIDWKKDYENHRKKIKEGLRLFGKYFESLWC